jgi:hypothetical protein
VQVDVPEALEAPDVPCVDLVERRVALVRDRPAVRDPVRVRQCGKIARRERWRRVRAAAVVAAIATAAGGEHDRGDGKERRQ